MQGTQSPPPRETGRDERHTVIDAPVSIRNASLTVVGVVAATFLLKEGRDFFIPLVLSVLISYALEPLVSALASWRVPRALAAAVVVALALGVLGVGLYALRGQATAIIEQMPDAARRIRTTLQQTERGAESPVQQVQEAATELERTAAETAPPSPAPRGIMRVQIEEPPFRVWEYIRWGTANVFAVGAQLMVATFLVYFILASGDLFKRKLVRIAGPVFSDRKLTLQILGEINRQIERFLLVRLTTSALVAVVSWLAFAWIGLEQAAFWGLAAGVFNSIPYFGPAVVTGGLAIVALLQFDSLGMAVLVAGAAGVITASEGFLLTPWLTGRAARMNAVAIFVGLLFWTWLWGLWGTLLAVPLLMILKAVCDRIEDLQPVGEMLGAEPAPDER